LGLSLVGSMVLDGEDLIVTDVGGIEQYSTSPEPSPFLGAVFRVHPPADPTKPLLAVVETLAGAGDLDASGLARGEAVEGEHLNFTGLLGAGALPDGTLLLVNDGVLVTAKTTGPQRLAASRLFGGPQKNPDCGSGAIDDKAVADQVFPTLASALGRFCASNALTSVSVHDGCDGSVAGATGMVQIAVPQVLSPFWTGAAGGSSVLRLKLACDVLDAPSALRRK
jgi:hypothetical protein